VHALQRDPWMLFTSSPVPAYLSWGLDDLPFHLTPFHPNPFRGHLVKLTLLSPPIEHSKLVLQSHYESCIIRIVVLAGIGTALGQRFRRSVCQAVSALRTGPQTARTTWFRTKSAFQLWVSNINDYNTIVHKNDINIYFMSDQYYNETFW